MKPHHGEIEALSSKDNIELLQQKVFAHLGCYAKDEMYIVPISYFYDNGYIYSHSRPGKKIQMMRDNPSICIQVEDVEDFFHWRSVIAWGKFEELPEEESIVAMRTILQRLSQSNVPTDFEIDVTAELETAIVFRMKIEKMTGRFEEEDFGEFSNAETITTFAEI